MFTRDADFASALVSEGPSPRYSASLTRFGHLVGSWDARGRRRNEGTGEWVERRFTWLVAFILEGHGVQDLEVVPSAGDPDATQTIATALRIYDPIAGAVRVTYASPVFNQYCSLVGVDWHDGIRQDGTQNDGRPIRWNFSAITDRSYVWDGWVSDNEGADWELVEHIEGTRIS